MAGVALLAFWRYLIGPKLLFDAIEHGDIRSMKIMARLGINPNSDMIPVGGPMQCAAAAGRTDSMAGLLELGADLNRLDEYGTTPLDAAVHMGQLESFRWLLAKGADPMVRDRHGYTVENLIPHSRLSEKDQQEYLTALEAAGYKKASPQ
jgi:ankyrin repeat protein